MQFLAKVRLPQRRPDVLRRPRLVDFLHQNVDKRLILVCAAAGYGKTTLLVDFAHDVGLPVCWYSVDAADADPKTFFEYLLLSMRQRFPEFGRQTEALLDSAGDVAREANSLVASLANEIQSDISDYFLLVLDDFHWVDASEAVSSALDALIYYLPDNCHIVLSSRSLPHLTFSRLAAQRQVAGLGTTDLRFTAEELNQLLRGNYKLAMPAAQVEQLAEASEGWITGVLLTTHTLWMGLVESLVKARGTGSQLFDYLANEAYLQQPPQVRRFLLASSVLGPMTPERCDRLFARGAAAEMLRYLVRANLFITELEGPGQWHRYHNLFQDFLQAKLKAEDPGLYTGLHRAAAEMEEAEGDWDRALAHYHAAGDLESTADLVERVGEEMIHAGRWKTLYTWLDSLPAATIDARARLSLFRGRTYLWVGEVDRGIEQLGRASQRYRLGGDLEGAGGALTLKSVGLRLRGRPAEALQACTEALETQSDRASRVAAEAYREIGICLAAQGQLSEAGAELQRALAIFEALGDEGDVATLCQAAGLLSVQAGDLARGMAFYRRALASWRRSGNVASTAGVLNCIASVHHWTGEYQHAQPLLDEALAKARQSGYLRIEAFALGTLGDVQRDSGNLQEAVQSYETALDYAQRIDETPLVNYLLDALANTHRLLGDYATAERLLRQAIQQAEENQSPYEVASYSVSAGVLAEEQDDLDRAEELLRSATERLAAAGARRDLARGRFHLARTLLRQGDLEGAGRELAACLELCRALGYDQFMVAEGQRAGELLAWAIARGTGGRRLERVAERLHHVQPPARVPSRPRIRLESTGPGRIEIHSLGVAQVRVDSRLVTTSDWTVEKTRELFFYLLEQPVGLRKEQILDVLWTEVEEGKANGQFHSTMHRLRRALSPQCVTFSDGRYQLTLGRSYWCDAEEFGQLLERAERPETDRRRRVESYERAVALYRGPFLEDFYSDWVTPRREELEQRYLRALGRLAKLRAEEGDLDRAMDLLRRAVATNPFQEEAYYGLIYYAALKGDRASALHQYRSYEKLLHEELGARPSENVAALARRVAMGESPPSL